MIKISNLSKQFKLYHKPSDRLKEIFFRKQYHHIYQALDNISFQVESGETFGILGKNGAGKSTLLKIITGVLLPDCGKIEVQGKVTGLLELGTGFDLQLSGIQNITSNGLLIGMTQDEISREQQAIIDFSELGDYINEPLRTYSSGMMMRLAFSIALHAKPDCFLIDEALSVGDAHFQQKCMHQIREFRQQGGSIIFVSHDLNAVKMVCDRAMVIDQGQVVSIGSAEDAVNHYNQIMAKLDSQDELVAITHAKKNYGNQKAKILTAKLLGENSKTDMVCCGEVAKVEVDILAQEDINDITIGIMIRDRFGQDIYGTNSYHLGCPLNVLKQQSYQCIFTFPVEITPGKYSITIALHSEDSHIENCYHWIDNMINFEVAGVKGKPFSGVCRLDANFEISHA